jgi:hypothetical protein
MDATQLRELATNALTNHWPAHLGVHTDAEKIEFLARILDKAAGEIAESNEAFERVDALEKENDALRGQLETFQEQIDAAKK